MGSFPAGSTVTLYLRARDNYGNAHTAGGAVQRVVIKRAGRREFNPSAELAHFVQKSRLGAPDVECSVEHIDGGVYQIECQVFTAGNHSICITDQCGNTHRMGTTLEVVSGSIYAPLCRLDPRNSYQGVMTESFVCYLYAFDQFLNPCSVAGNLASVHATVGNQTMTAIPASQVTKGRLPVVAGFTLIALKFTPHSKGIQQLNVRIGSEAIPGCPVEVNVVPLTTSFPMRLKELRHYLRMRYCKFGYTPTITINREDILESAVRELQDQYFHRTIRVRFGDEVGIDTGGVSRYVHMYM